MKLSMWFLLTLMILDISCQADEVKRGEKSDVEVKDNKKVNKRSAFHYGLPFNYAGSFGYNLPFGPLSVSKYTHGLHAPPLFGPNVPYVLRSGNAEVTSYNVNYPQVAFTQHKVLPQFPLPVAANPITPISFFPQGNFLHTGVLPSYLQPTNILAPSGVLPPANVLPAAPIHPVHTTQTVVRPIVFPSNFFIPQKPVSIPAAPVVPLVPAQKPQIPTFQFTIPVNALHPGFVQPTPVNPSGGSAELGPQQPQVPTTFPTPTAPPTVSSNQPWRPIQITPTTPVNPETHRPSITLLPPYKGEGGRDLSGPEIPFDDAPQFPQNDIRHLLEGGETVNTGNRERFEPPPSSYDVPLQGNKGYHY